MEKRMELEEFRRKGLEVAAAEAAFKEVRRDEAYKTYHVADCRRVWGRYDMSCPRCQELKGGAPARRGWRVYR